MTKPSEINSTTATPKAVTPSTANVAPKTRKSEPVRNPAFREHEGLRALQKQLNSGARRPAARKSK